LCGSAGGVCWNAAPPSPAVMRSALLTLCLLLPLVLTAAGDVAVGRFSVTGLAGWEPHRFSGETRYRLVEQGGVQVVEARSDGTASGLYRRVHVDLTRTPILHWRWRVENTLPGVDERTRAGDDYPARIYVVREGGLAFWRTRALSYVWASGQPAGSHWPNAFTDRAGMIAVRSGRAGLMAWQEERRDVRADFRQLFGEEITEVDVVALMTDTDNSGGSARAFYGDIRFAPE